ncbi:MAG: UvrD-helicase domain-containing protein [Lachnospiraceae bacterium]|nr:UvrD-helicase domain-containing protein [Lachnospiraceae bacterium]
MDPNQFALRALTSNNNLSWLLYHARIIAPAYQEYQKELQRNQAFDFNNLIMMMIKLFCREPEILDRFQEHFRYISIDEYQDTNIAQFEFVNLLAKKYQNICAVGDDNQSIYKFQGANIENILNFEEAFPKTKIIRLEQNYRSTKTILDAANHVIQNNTKRKEKSLWTENETGTKIQFFHTKSPYTEASLIIEQILKFLRDGYSFNDFACLYRTNAQSRIL